MSTTVNDDRARAQAPASHAAASINSADRSFADYQTRHLLPIVRGITRAGCVAYAAAILIGLAADVIEISLLWRVIVVALAIGASAAALERERAQQGWVAYAFMFLCVYEIGIGVFASANTLGVAWVIPAFAMMPVVTSTAWMSYRHFAAATVITVTAPFVTFALLHASKIDLYELLTYVFTATITSAVIHVYFSRLQHAHYQLERKLLEQAHTDDLTGIFVRQRFHELADLAVRRAQHRGEAVSALFIDVDRFKSINDAFGHLVGDAALVLVATALQDRLRPIDVFGRLGGDEFAVVLPNCRAHTAMQVAQRLRAAVAGLDSPAGQLTISVGVAEMRDSAFGLIGLLDDADVALLAAKAAGRNRVEFFQAPE
ncbi:GGDEF domain-containing protein [Pararobbsia silviterrae]|uniref:diguanylate cyclase n=1 Tax=Pararobbsia silviterrae TaxID=1792498 RepID=A0A494X691_9BURK|nr:GGDEF domain-containing protein [Pararobbsia silviterrae]RKP46217.1 GGDEF domain-containing protein [Pararobbsia silviterrae]